MNLLEKSSDTQLREQIDRSLSRRKLIQLIKKRYQEN